MAAKKRSAYRARLVSVERLSHPESLVWNKVTWETKFGEQVSANTFPGGDVNRQVENLPANVRVNVILNGRRQVIFVEKVTG